MRFNKKRKIVWWICFMVLFSITTARINFLRVSQNKEPILVLKNSAIKDGGTRYYGLGYRIICWNLPFTEYKSEMDILIFYKVYP